MTVTAKIQHNPDSGRPRGMARGLSMLAMRRHGTVRLGVKTERGVLDVPEAAERLRTYAPITLDDLLQSEDGPSLNALVDAGLQSDHCQDAFLDEESIVFAPLLSCPEKIVCVGLNYRKHAKEVNLPILKQPWLFSKLNHALSAHNSKARPPVEIAHKFDYETELFIEIGKQASNL